MTGPGEASDADLLEQATEGAPEQRLTSSDVPLEADTADALEQATVVPEPDDDRR